MSDLFSNLAALSLGGIVGVQPLVPSLFAPAPQVLSDATLPAFNDQLAEAAENTVFSVTPPIVADGTDAPLMGELSDKVVTPEKSTMLSDLVPPDIPQSTIDTYPHIHSAKGEASRFSLVYQHQRKADGASLPQPLQRQEATLRNTGNLEITSYSMLHEEQQHSAEKTSPAAPAGYQTQQTTPKDHPVISTVDVSHDQKLSMTLDKTIETILSDKPAKPLPIQPSLPVSIPSLPGDDLSEQDVSVDEVLNQKYSSPMQPHIQPANYPADIERLMAPNPDVYESVSIVPESKRRATVDEQPEATSQPLSRLDEHTIKLVPDQHPVAKEREDLQSHSEVSTPKGIPQSAKAWLRVPTALEMSHSISTVYPSNVRDALHSSQVDSKLEAPRVEAENEVFPINITIGRVVVRAAQASQPTPIKKRVLRPAQSLDEYLKQRERGSR